MGLLATGPFPDALRAAIKTSRLSLDRIQHRLGLRGITISVATLSYWQSGRRRPERPESLEALRHLEAVLGVPPSALTALLGPPRPRGRRSRPTRVLPIDALWSRRERLASLLARVDISSDCRLGRLSQHDRIEVAADAETLMCQLNESMDVEGHSIRVGASVGVALFPDDATNVEALRVAADLRMYDTKHENRESAPVPAMKRSPASEKESAHAADLPVASGTFTA